MPSFFAPVAPRSTSIIVLRHQKWQRYRIITSLSVGSSTQVLEVDPTRAGGGALLLAENNEFRDEASAVLAQEQNGFVTIARGSAILGYVAARAQAAVLLATRVEQTAVLPGGHRVLLVQEAQWVFLGLDGLMSLEEERFWTLIQQQNVCGSHYYCETADITRPFPSLFPPTKPQSEFVWNAWMAQPFSSLGLHYHCPPLLQGAAESIDEVNTFGQRYAFCLLSRRSRRHPGTRYNARGLNDLAGPGNEIEAELIMWTPSSSSSYENAPPWTARSGSENDRVPTEATEDDDAETIGALPRRTAQTTAAAAHGQRNGSEYADQTRKQESLRWARVVWRRGTVPIRWGVEIQPLNKGLQAEIYVKEQGTYHGTLTYFRGLQRQVMEDATPSSLRGKTARRDFKGEGIDGSRSLKACGDKGGASASGFEQSHIGTILCINLLHCNPKKAAELMLSSYYQEGMQHVRSHLSLFRSESTMQHRRMGGSEDMVSLPNPEKPAKRHYESLGSPPRLLNFDWHGTMNNLTEERGIEAFWTFIDRPVRQTGFAMGDMVPCTDDDVPALNGQRGTAKEISNGSIWKESEKKHHKDEDDEDETMDLDHEDVTAWGQQWKMRWFRRQNGILRFNCADSLDRTNAATCFAALPVLYEGLRVLGIALNATGHRSGPSRSPSPKTDHTDWSSSGTRQAGVDGGADPGRRGDEAIEEVLPKGWERATYNGRTLYVDHNTRKTQWEPPEGVIYRVENDMSKTKDPGVGSGRRQEDATEWSFFSYSLDDVRSRLHPDAVADFVSAFKRHGDVHSSLYTGSPAMHSHVLGLVLHAEARPYGGASTGVGRLQNLRVAVQRRWNNAVSDDARQAAIEVFLGLNIYTHCPGVMIPYNPELKDLQGPDQNDVDEVEEQREEIHHPEELEREGLHLSTQDGRVGVADDLTGLESVEDFQEDDAARCEATTVAFEGMGCSEAGGKTELEEDDAEGRDKDKRVPRSTGDADQEFLGITTQGDAFADPLGVLNADV